jgi:hypothetical protein
MSEQRPETSREPRVYTIAGYTRLSPALHMLYLNGNDINAIDVQNGGRKGSETLRVRQGVCCFCTEVVKKRSRAYMARMVGRRCLASTMAEMARGVTMSAARRTALGPFACDKSPLLTALLLGCCWLSLLKRPGCLIQKRRGPTCARR